MTWQALWLYDEASSGVAPLGVADHLASPIALPIAYGAGGAWTSVAAGSGLSEGGAVATHAQSATGQNATKLACLGTTTWTIEIVISLPFSGTDRVFFSCNDADAHAATVTLASFWQSANKLTVYLDQIGFAGTFDVSALSSGAHPVHVVYDSTQTAAADRIRLYIDGTQRPLTVEGGSFPAQNSAQSMFSGSRISAGAYAGGAYPFLSGSIFELAVADHAASAAECGSRSAALLSDNDSNPSASGPSIVSMQIEVNQAQVTGSGPKFPAVGLTTTATQSVSRRHAIAAVRVATQRLAGSLSRVLSRTDRVDQSQVAPFARSVMRSLLGLVSQAVQGGRGVSRTLSATATATAAGGISLPGGGNTGLTLAASAGQSVLVTRVVQRVLLAEQRQGDGAPTARELSTTQAQSPTLSRRVELLRKA